MTPETAASSGLEPIVRSYLEAWDQQDLDRCLEFFAPDASVHFMSGTYEGRDEIAQWHRDRFAAGLQVLRIDELSVDGNTVNVEGVIASNRLRAWGIDSLSGTMTTSFDRDRIKHVKFGARFPRM